MDEALPSLTQVRRSRLLTLDGLARKSGVGKRTIQQIEKGRAVPMLATVAKLAKALDVEPVHVVEFRNAIEKG